MPGVLKHYEIHLLKEKLLNHFESIIHELLFWMFWTVWRLRLFGQVEEIQNNFILVGIYWYFSAWFGFGCDLVQLQK